MIHLTQQGLVDGVIFMEVRLQDERMVHLRELGFPFCMIGRTENNSGIGFVDLDHARAVEEDFDYLVDQGHSKIAYIDYPFELAQAGYGPASFSAYGGSLLNLLTAALQSLLLYHSSLIAPQPLRTSITPKTLVNNF